MPVLAEKAMTVEEFLTFAADKRGKWELVDGQALAMSPGRVVHGDLKYRVARALDGAIARARLPCRFVLDSAAVKIDQLNSFQPDAMVYCGAPLPPDAFFVPNPSVVIEIPMPGSRAARFVPKARRLFQGEERRALPHRQPRRAAHHPPPAARRRCSDAHLPRGNDQARSAGHGSERGGDLRVCRVRESVGALAIGSSPSLDHFAMLATTGRIVHSTKSASRSVAHHSGHSGQKPASAAFSKLQEQAGESSSRASPSPVPPP